MNEEIDEDMIRGYKCRKCGFGVCKDEAFARRKDLTCICLNCSVAKNKGTPTHEIKLINSIIWNNRVKGKKLLLRNYDWLDYNGEVKEQ